MLGIVFLAMRAPCGVRTLCTAFESFLLAAPIFPKVRAFPVRGFWFNRFNGLSRSLVGPTFAVETEILSDLEVISRSSAVALKGTTLSLAEIGIKLGVANIVTGSVNRSGKPGALTGCEGGSHRKTRKSRRFLVNFWQGFSALPTLVSIDGRFRRPGCKRLEF